MAAAQVSAQTPIPGLLTKDQVTPHYQAHYGGALKRFTALEQQLDTLYQGKEPLGGDALAFIHKDKINRMNSVLLHELYFDGLTPQPGDPTADIRAALTKRFGSLDRWIEDFKTCCQAANGWGILARDLVNGRLYNVSSDLHEIGVRMISDFFEMEGWDTFYLGASTPVETILETVRSRRPDVVAISVTMPYHVSEAARLIAMIRAAELQPAPHVLVGGRAFVDDDGLWRDIGADATAQDASLAVAIASELVEGSR